MAEGMGESKQVDATNIKSGSFVIFDGIACVVKNIDISKAGKHGHAKCRIEAVGIKDGRKIIKVMPGHDKVEVPIIEKRNAQVLSITENSANIMDMESYETFDIGIPEEFIGKLKEGMQVLYWLVMGDKIIKQIRSSGE